MVVIKLHLCCACMSSDLVLDEPDNFGTEDLPALTRLVHCAGLLGSRVLLSSATLPPSLVQGLFQAYLEGRRSYQCNRGIPGQPSNVCCAWFDEFGAEASDHASGDSYQKAHKAFVNNRLEKLAQAEVRRCAEIQRLPIPHGQKPETVCAELAMRPAPTVAYAAQPASQRRSGHGKASQLWSDPHGQY